MNTLRYLLLNLDKDKAVNIFYELYPDFVNNVALRLPYKNISDIYNEEYPDSPKLTYLATIGVLLSETNFLTQYLESLTDDQFIEEFVKIAGIIKIDTGRNIGIGRDLAKRAVKNHELIRYVSYLHNRQSFFLELLKLDPDFALQNYREEIDQILFHQLRGLDLTNPKMLKYMLSRRNESKLSVSYNFKEFIRILSENRTNNTEDLIKMVILTYKDDVGCNGIVDMTDEVFYTLNGRSDEYIIYRNDIPNLPSSLQDSKSDFIAYIEILREICGKNFVNSRLNEDVLEFLAEDV